MFKISIISFSLTKGGAGIAADRYKKILSENIKCDHVGSINQDNAGLFQFFKRLIAFGLMKLQFTRNPIKHSLNLFSYNPVIQAFKSSKDTLYHLHWINNDTLSVFDFDKIPSGSIVTLHDEWLYCGAEHHYDDLDESKDFLSSYKYLKKGILGIHWNSIIWEVKYKKLAHRNDLIYTTPSNWMYMRAKSSQILKESDIRLLPNPIDTEIFKPSTDNEAESCRKSLNIDKECFVFVFAACMKRSNKLKGLDLLFTALNKLQTKNLNIPVSKIVLIDFGGLKKEAKLFNYRHISIGRIYDSVYLAKIYSMADCVIVPSLFESFGQVSAEALSCCTPVVCFNTSGLKDIIIDNYNGLIANEISADALCYELKKITNLSRKCRSEMGKNGRKHVQEKYSYPIITKKYLNILKDALALKEITNENINHNSSSK